MSDAKTGCELFRRGGCRRLGDDDRDRIWRLRCRRRPRVPEVPTMTASRGAYKCRFWMCWPPCRVPSQVAPTNQIGAMHRQRW
ncbi:hypothetical protein E2562_038793 [Oryza meyeriana var. granulata]|uniref:Uncharacterized protein n=1 Tax=Oryza meyeriana var. granulata TaxID=110450 RepID=A0A6G1C3K5_9ORYZ|nr:hypothetical protein E2562_038793 [Oryza meyeriana var. granulata]